MDLTYNPIYQQYLVMELLVQADEIGGETRVYEDPEGTVHVITQTGPLVKIAAFPNSQKELIVRGHQSSRVIEGLQIFIN